MITGLLDSIEKSAYAQAAAAYGMTAAAAAQNPQIKAAVENGLQTNESYQAMLSLKAQLDAYAAFYQGLLSYTNGVDSAANGATELKNGLVVLNSGAQELSTSVKKLDDGAISVYNGIITLKDGVASLSGGVIEMQGGVTELYDGIVTLKEGTFTFCESTADLEETLKEKIRSMIDELFGGNFDMVSFVSEKNTDVKSVQFVIQTDGVKLPAEAAAVPVAEEKLNFWQKLLRLFGLY